MIPNLRHAMVSCEDITRLLVSIKLRHELLRLTDDVVDNADVVHVFLAEGFRELWIIDSVKIQYLRVRPIRVPGCV